MDPDQFDRLIRLQTQFLRIQRDLLNASFDLEELTRELLVANPPPIKQTGNHYFTGCRYLSPLRCWDRFDSPQLLVAGLLLFSFSFADIFL